ncbi:MAG: hypothetical protein AAF267_20670, partial [Deinococcota bacterium]
MMVMGSASTYANGKMMTLKRLTLTAVLICCLGASLANAQRLTALPNDSRFDTPITLTTALGGESLGAIITAIANSVGLTPVLEDVPDDLVNYEIVDPKPFRQVWNLVLSLNGLDYQLLPNDIIVVGLTEAIGTVGERRFVAGEEIPLETRFYFTRFAEPEQIEEQLNTLISNIDTDDLLVFCQKSNLLELPVFFESNAFSFDYLPVLAQIHIHGTSRIANIFYFSHYRKLIS